MIEPFELSGREYIAGQIGHKTLIRILGEFDTNNAKVDIIEISRILQEIKMTTIDSYDGVVKSVFARCAKSQALIHINIKYSFWGKVKGLKEAIAVHVFCSDKEIGAAFNQMGHIVISFIASVCKDYGP